VAGMVGELIQLATRAGAASSSPTFGWRVTGIVGIGGAIGIVAASLVGTLWAIVAILALVRQWRRLG
jgi:hypothetical protein